MLYRDFATTEELDAQYDLTRTVPDVEVYARFYAEESEKLRGEIDHRLGVPFGPTLAEHVDVYPAGEGAPVLVYVHGGYWRSRTGREFGFVARGPHERGAAVVATNYALCPAVTIDEIVRQTRAAVAWTYKNAASFGSDPERLYVAGHSAGAHLAMLLLSTDWAGEYGLPADIVKGVTGISGIYDLAPLPYTFLQPQLQLGWDQVRRNSPINHIPQSAPSLLVSYGSKEPAEFARQSEDYLAAWRAQGLDGELLVLPGKNHYDVIDGFLNAESSLCSSVLARMGLE